MEHGQQGNIRWKFGASRNAMSDTDRCLCDCSEPCACYAGGYASGSGTETGSGTAFPEGRFERLGLL